MINEQSVLDHSTDLNIDENQRLTKPAKKRKMRRSKKAKPANIDEHKPI